MCRVSSMYVWVRAYVPLRMRRKNYRHNSHVERRDVCVCVYEMCMQLSGCGKET